MLLRYITLINKSNLKTHVLKPQYDFYHTYNTVIYNTFWTTLYNVYTLNAMYKLACCLVIRR